MGSWSTHRQWLVLLAGLFVAGEAVLSLQSGWIGWLGDIALAALLVGGVVALATSSERRIARSLVEIEEAVLRLGKGDFEEAVAPPSAPSVARMAGALEYARKRLAKRYDDLARSRATLSDQLAQARAQLSDPVTERRRDNLTKLRLVVEIEVAGTRQPAELVDLWLDHLELALDRGLAKEMVHGQPAMIRMTTPDGVTMEHPAVAHAHSRSRHGGRVGWSFDWCTPVAPADLWPPLWHAINPRTEVRLRPADTDGLRAVLHVDERNHTARVLDLSKGGVGVFVAATMEQLGLVGHGAFAALTLELPGERSFRERVWVRSVDVRPDGTRLGLALEGLDPAATALLAGYLVELQQAAERDDSPLEFTM